MINRARLNTAVTEHLRRLIPGEPAAPPADGPAQPSNPPVGQAVPEGERLLAEAESIKAAVATMDPPTYRGLSCWLCDGHMQPCSRADCPKVWRMRDDPWKKDPTC